MEGWTSNGIVRNRIFRIQGFSGLYCLNRGLREFYSKTHNYLDIAGGEDAILASGGGVRLLTDCLYIFGLYYRTFSYEIINVLLGLKLPPTKEVGRACQKFYTPGA